MAEARGGYGPAFVGLGRVLGSLVRARPDRPALTDRHGTLTHRELFAAVRGAARRLPPGPVLVHEADPRNLVVRVLAGCWARRAVTVVPVGAGDAALRRAHETRARGLTFCTSGTTGSPRPAPAARGLPVLAQRLGIIGLVRIPPLPTVGCLAPVDRGHGFSALALTLAFGGHCVLGEEAVRAQGRVDLLTGVPLQLEEFAADPPRTGIGAVLSGSDVLRDPDALAAALDAPVYDAWGSSEAGTLAVASPADRRRSPGTVGRPLPGVVVREREGVLEVRSPVLGRRVFAADRGHLDDGLVHVTGRADAVRVSAGVNLDEDAVRVWLAQHDPEATMTRRDDARFGTRLHVETPRDAGRLRAAMRREFGIAAPTVGAPEVS